MNERTNYDVVIIGGGPAGIAAAIWCWDLGLTNTILEQKVELGGQLLRIFAPIRNYPGLVTENGSEMRDRFHGSISETNCVVRLEAKLRNIDLDSKTVELADGGVVQGRAVIIATGVRRRTLDVAGENEFTGRGILTSGAKEKHLVKNARVLIVGGGDAALENALILAEQASKVIVVHRRNEFSARKEFVESAAGKPNVEFKPGRSVKGFFGGDHLSEVEIVDEIGRISRIAVDFALVRIGVQPNIESFRKQIETTSGGYAVVSAEFETSCANVFAIGDVACPNSPTISTAVGSAAIAVKKLKSSVQSSKSNPKI